MLLILSVSYVELMSSLTFGCENKCICCDGAVCVHHTSGL